MNAGWRSGGERCRSATHRGITNRKLIETMSRGAAISPFPDQSNHIGSKDFPMPEKTHTRVANPSALAVYDADLRVDRLPHRTRAGELDRGSRRDIRLRGHNLQCYAEGRWRV